MLKVFIFVNILFSGIILINCDEKRPFVIFGHLANSPFYVKESLDQGANGIEADLTMYEDRRERNSDWLYLYHPSLTDCHCAEACQVAKGEANTDLKSYLEYISSITVPNTPQYRNNFAYLMLDLKIVDKKYSVKQYAGYDTCQLVSKYLYGPKNSNGSTVKIIFSMNSERDADFISWCKKGLDEMNEGWLFEKFHWDVSKVENLDAIENMWRQYGIKNTWQGDGRCACFLRDFKYISWAVGRRNKENSVIKRVYRWTIDHPPAVFVNLWLFKQEGDSIWATMDNDVDAVITNSVSSVKEYILGNYSSKFYLETNPGYL